MISGATDSFYGLNTVRGTWISSERADTSPDASHPIPGPRFSQILQYFQPLTQPLTSKGSDQQQVQNVLDLVENLVQFSVPTLAHLVALLCNQTPNHPDSKASLIIVDSFSTLIGNAFPRTSDSTSTPKKPGGSNISLRLLMSIII